MGDWLVSWLTWQYNTFKDICLDCVLRVNVTALSFCCKWIHAPSRLICWLYLTNLSISEDLVVIFKTTHMHNTWKIYELAKYRNEIQQNSSFWSCSKQLTAASVLNATSSYLLSDFSRANFSIAISAFLNIPDGSPAKFKPNTLTQWCFPCWQDVYT